ncbi:hypothetical protein C0989_010571 [Termitomyces sp. Mn162]|nr:hypothetical protein C0989_010571 [Termitomyces sp. Mn162]
MHTPAKPDYPIITLEEIVKYDAFLFGMPTRYGMMPAQWKTFWDSTGKLWRSGALYGKYASIFSSTAGPGGGQEVTALNSMSTLVHHGIIYVPLGYAHSFAELSGVDEVHGGTCNSNSVIIDLIHLTPLGSPWGAGTFAKDDGSRQPTDLELKIAKIHGRTFWLNVSRVKF